MAKPLNNLQRDLQGVRESGVYIDQPAIGNYASKPLTTAQSLDDIPDIAGLSESLLKGYIQLKSADNKEKFELGAAQGQRDSFKEFNKLVDEGAIPEGANPYFIAGYRTSIARKYSQEEAQEIQMAWQAAEDNYISRSSSGLAIDANLTPPDIATIMQQARDKKWTDLAVKNPAIANDPYFNKELGDHSGRLYSTLQQDLSQKSLKAQTDVAKNQLAMEGGSLFEQYADGKLSADSMEQFAGVLHRSGIRDPHTFMLDVAKSRVMREINNVDEFGDTVNPERAENLYKLAGQIKVNGVPLSEGTKAEDYGALGKHVSTGLSSGGGTTGRYDRWYGKMLLQPDNPIRQIILSKDQDQAKDLAKQHWIEVALNPKLYGINPAHVPEFQKTILGTADTWIKLDKDSIDNTNNIIVELTRRGLVDQAQESVLDLPESMRLGGYQKIQDTNKESDTFIRTNPSYKELEENLTILSSKNKDSFSINNSRDEMLGSARNEAMALLSQATTPVGKQRVLDNLPKVFDKHEKRFQSVVAEHNKAFDDITKHVVSGGIPGVSSRDKIIAGLSKGSITPDQAKDLMIQDGKNTDIYDYTNSIDFNNSLNKMAELYILESGKYDPNSFKKERPSTSGSIAELILSDTDTGTSSPQQQQYYNALNNDGLVERNKLVSRITKDINDGVKSGVIKSRGDIMQYITNGLSGGTPIGTPKQPEEMIIPKPPKLIQPPNEPSMNEAYNVQLLADSIATWYTDNQLGIKNMVNKIGNIPANIMARMNIPSLHTTQYATDKSIPTGLFDIMIESKLQYTPKVATVDDVDIRKISTKWSDVIAKDINSGNTGILDRVALEDVLLKLNRPYGITAKDILAGHIKLNNTSYVISGRNKLPPTLWMDTPIFSSEEEVLELAADPNKVISLMNILGLQTEGLGPKQLEAQFEKLWSAQRYIMIQYKNQE